MAHKTAPCQLPASVFGPSDVARLKRELALFDDAMHQAALRSRAGAAAADPQPGQQLQQIAELNELKLADASARQQLLAGLDAWLTGAPTLTMSFASDPSAAFMTRVVTWLRTNISPTVMVRVGLQPTIAAGCTLRTSSHVYDFSLRHHFTERRPELIEKLRQFQPAAAQVAAAPAAKLSPAASDPANRPAVPADAKPAAAAAKPPVPVGTPAAKPLAAAAAPEGPAA